MTMTPCPGICRHCGCSEVRPCRLEDNEFCCWFDARRTVCSNPHCIAAEQTRRAAEEAAVKAARRKRTPAEVHAQIRQEQKQKQRDYRLRRKGRAA